jgi:histidyl-tRNA synthetase
LGTRQIFGAFFFCINSDRMMPLVKYQTIKGTFDRLPEDAPKWNFVLEQAKQVLERSGAEEIHTPVFEDTGVFTKAVGESSDIVRKEMYSFTDKGERDLCLRPEATAPLIRAYLQHGMGSKPTPVKLWTFEPMFRAEKPQRGRQRQFHQLGLEIIGLADAIADAECIQIGWSIMEKLKIKKYKIHLGSVGDPQDRINYNHYLRDVLSSVMQRLSSDSQERLKVNPLRILDSKDQNDQAILKELAVRPMFDFLNSDALQHHKQVNDYLLELGIEKERIVEDKSIVRGLDYYRRTAFEFIHESPVLGAQSTILAGGRYDGLAEILGGPYTPGVGWGSGIERLLLALEAENIVLPEPESLLVYVIPLHEGRLATAHKLAQEIRGFGKSAAPYKLKGLGKMLTDASKRGARYVAIINEDSLGGIGLTDLRVKDLQTGFEENIPFDGLKDYLLRKLKEEGKTT